MAQSAECRKLGRRRFAGNCAHPVEEIGLAGLAREGQSSVATVVNKGEMDPLSKRWARDHHVLSGRLVR